jgi:hypothetical protein
MNNHDASIVERIRSDLGGCSKKVICRYLGIKQEELTSHLGENSEPITTSKVGQRLRALDFVLKIAKQSGVTEPGALHRALTRPAFEEKDGWKIGVIMGIQNDASPEILTKILKNALTIWCRTTSTAGVDEK